MNFERVSGLDRSSFCVNGVSQSVVKHFVFFRFFVCVRDFCSACHPVPTLNATDGFLSQFWGRGGYLSLHFGGTFSNERTLANAVHLLSFPGVNLTNPEILIVYGSFRPAMG